MKSVGLRQLRGRLKRSRLVRNILYRPFTDADKPKLLPATRQRLRERFREDVLRLEELVGRDVAKQWGYQE